MKQMSSNVFRKNKESRCFVLFIIFRAVLRTSVAFNPHTESQLFDKVMQTCKFLHNYIILYGATRIEVPQTSKITYSTSFQDQRVLFPPLHHTQKGPGNEVTLLFFMRRSFTVAQTGTPSSSKSWSRDRRAVSADLSS